MSSLRDRALAAWPSGATSLIAAIFAVVLFAAGLFAGLGASWWLSTPAPQIAAAPPPSAPAQPAKEAKDESVAESADECEQQTWPYLDDKCRARLAEKSQASREVRVITIDRSAPPTLTTTPAPPPEKQPAAQQAPRETTGRAAEAPRDQPTVAAAAATDQNAPEMSTTANIPSMRTATTPPPTPAASSDPPLASEAVKTAETEQAIPSKRSKRADRRKDRQTKATDAAVPAAPNVPDLSTTPAASSDPPPASEAVKTAESEQTIPSRRSKRADRRKDWESKTARARTRPRDDDAVPAGGTVRTYEMQGGGRVTVYQRGPTMQVGDRVEFGDEPRSRRRVHGVPAARASRYSDDLSSLPIVTRGRGGEYFVER